MTKNWDKLQRIKYRDAANWNKEAESFKKKFFENKMTIKSLQDATNKRDPEAMFNLAQCYRFGEGVTEDRAMAAQLFRKLASSTEISDIRTESMFTMGEILRLARAEPVTKKITDDQWYKKSTPSEVLDQKMQPQFKTEKAKWYGIAVADAQTKKDKPPYKRPPYFPELAFQYAECCARGEILRDGNKPIAAMWYELAAEVGHTEAQCEIGKCYDLGKGVTQDRKQALKWHTKAAEKNHPDSLIYLAKAAYQDSRKTEISDDRRTYLMDLSQEYLTRADKAGSSGIGLVDKILSHKLNIIEIGIAEEAEILNHDESEAILMEQHEKYAKQPKSKLEKASSAEPLKQKPLRSKL